MEDDFKEIIASEFPNDGIKADIAAIIATDDVRHNCAFCHRERSTKDDNHAPECPYWLFFG